MARVLKRTCLLENIIFQVLFQTLGVEWCVFLMHFFFNRAEKMAELALACPKLFMNSQRCRTSGRTLLSGFDVLGGGFQTFFMFTRILGEMIQFDEHIFRMGGPTTN